MLLALETASDAGGVALLESPSAAQPTLLGEERIDAGQRHAATLLLALDRLLRATDRKLEQVELIALSIGPGSFTGLRIGLATALGLCFGTPRRIVPVPTLAALALRAGSGACVAPLLDARRGQIYAGLYDAAGNPLRADVVAPPERFLDCLPAKGEITLLGSGAERYRAQIERRLGARARFGTAEQGEPSAASVARLGARLAAAGAARDPQDVEPLYLRPPEARLPGA